MTSYAVVKERSRVMLVGWLNKSVGFVMRRRRWRLKVHSV